MSDKLPLHTITAKMAEEGETWGWKISCPYDPTDETRPCWPLDIDQEPSVPLPAPQGCNYDEWVDNVGSVCVDGNDVTISFKTEVLWSGDFPTFRLVE